MKRLISGGAVAALLLVGVAPLAANATGSDSPTPYTVTREGVTLPSGDTFPAHGHVNIRWTNPDGSAGIHFDPNNGHPGAQWIGKGFIPWSAFGVPKAACVTWVQISHYNEHYGEGGQEPVCLKDKPEPTPAPSPEPSPDPEPSPSPTPTPDPEPTPTPTPDPEPTPEPTPDPDPTPDPEPTPEPAPSEDPEPTPTPSPDPTPTPDPTPDPEPEPDDPREEEPDLPELPETGPQDIRTALGVALLLLIGGGYLVGMRKLALRMVD